jgi:hypothetical protein
VVFVDIPDPLGHFLVVLVCRRGGHGLQDAVNQVQEEIGLAQIERSTFGLGLALPVYGFTEGSVPLRATLNWAGIEVQPYLVESGLTDTYSSRIVAAEWYY